MAVSFGPKGLTCHSSDPLERRGRWPLKQKLLPSPCTQQREVVWSSQGLVVSPWVRYPEWRKSFSSLMALAPPQRNSLFLPPELTSGKHWTHTARHWAGIPDAVGLAPGPQGVCGLVGRKNEAYGFERIRTPRSPGVEEQTGSVKLSVGGMYSWLGQL